MIVLISGSRKWRAPERTRMQEYVKKVCDKANLLEYNVICGDAKGVDELVVELADNVTVYGIQDAPRCNIPEGKKVEYTYLDWAIKYNDRDMEMVELADVVVCVWNGSSRGTKAVYDYALELGKTVKLWAAYERSISSEGH